uniref:DNA polymerase n=1 Tax=Ganoderma boninense TaxID=34458 RepID=A0A5K1JX92_9APHY|nr:DNA polymerase (EC [Ganoderma boninense]
MSSQPQPLRVKINHIDYTMAPPGPLDNSVLHRVPVIRIYGDSSVGLKACLHIHQVYPYFFVEYLGKMNPDIGASLLILLQTLRLNNRIPVNRYVTKLKHSLNHAIAISMKRNPQSPKSQFVRAVVLVKGVHFYGFHSNYSPFLKVHIADPAFVNRAVTIVQSGTIMKTRFRVYESHLSYILQFLSDFGLYGCGWIDLGEVWQRGRDEFSEDERIDSELARTLSEFKDSPYHRQTRMPLEVDASAPQVLNRHKLRARKMHHKLTIPAPELPPEPLVLSVRELWEDERKRRAAKGLAPSPEIPKDLSANSRGPGGDWVSEARWWEEIRKRIERERGHEALPLKMSWEKWVMTTFESVEALWEERYKTWKPHASQDDAKDDRSESETVTEEVNPYQSSQMPPLSGISRDGQLEEDYSDVDVDETMLASQDMTRLMEHEEAEWGAEANEYLELEIEEEFPEEEEEGPPPDLQSEVGDVEDRPSDPFKDSGEAPSSPSTLGNQFKDIWSKITKYDIHGTLSVCPLEWSKNSHQTIFPILESSPFVSKARRYTPSWATPTKSQTPPASIQVPVKRPFSDTKEKEPVDPRPTPVTDSPRTIFQPLHANLVEEEVLPQLDVEVFDGLPESTISVDVDLRPSKRRRLEPPPPEARNVTSHSSPSHPTPGRLTATHLSSQPMMLPSALRSLHNGKNTYVYATRPPTSAELLGSTDEHGIPSKLYRSPWYSKEGDAPERPREYAGLVFHLEGGEGIGNLEGWESGEAASSSSGEPAQPLDPTGVRGWEYASTPPTARQVRKWLKEQKGHLDARTVRIKDSSQIEGPTQRNPYGLQSTLAPRSDKAQRAGQNMTVLTLEVFAPSKGDLIPNPDDDEVAAVFYCFQRHDREVGEALTCESGIIAVDSDQLSPRRLRSIQADFVDSELELLNRLIDVVLELDPDVLSGWEVQAASWGYLSTRGRSYGLDLGEQISRAPGRTAGGYDGWALKTSSTFKVIGRHVLNLWRIMRSEHTFTIYTFEHVTFQLLHRRTPWYSPRTLTEWYNSLVPEHTDRVVRYFASRTSMVLEMLDVAEVVTKNAEFARVFGVDFFSVLSRGSQFKVESFMFRIAKPECFVLLSPSKQDVGKQNAAECMPLIMEPLSAFYSSPLVVLDFQSLYPSIMIAYNYCYSTCLGRITDFKGTYKFGVTDLRQPAGILDTLQDYINVAPNGLMYVKPTVRKGLLGRMLTELLDTRVMVKQAMKSALRRILDARQLGLKFIANVTYGYTSATFSGRMPAVEIADSIVQSGRETLEKAIRTIDSTKKWGAKVVYGDTDSLFIYLPGKTKEQAFRIGQDMADTITSMNPAPVKLKFEKVYLPCVLMAKKRYVGFKFENPDDKEPAFDAKGIETVRRDGVPAQQKMTETCLKILFRTQDLSEIKDYCCRTWGRIMENKVSVQDFIFAKEVKMGTYSDKVPPPPGVTVAARRMLEDPNDEPQYGERIPHKRLDAAYYISRVLIPPLERIFNLVGADVRSWFDDMPKSLRADQPDITLSPRKNRRSVMVANALNIDDHFTSLHCLICGMFTPDEVVQCESLDCPWMYERKKLESKADALTTIHDLIEEMENGWTVEDSGSDNGTELEFEDADLSDCSIVAYSDSDRDSRAVTPVAL